MTISPYLLKPLRQEHEVPHMRCPYSTTGRRCSDSMCLSHGCQHLPETSRPDSPVGIATAGVSACPPDTPATSSNAARVHSGVAPANAAHQATLYDGPGSAASETVKGCEPATNGDGMSMNFEDIP